jgi:hypothetical protein
MIGSGMPISQSSAPLPKPMIASYAASTGSGVDALAKGDGVELFAAFSSLRSW